MASNERFIRDLFNDIAADGFEKQFEDALHEDRVWVATGSSPVSGEYKGKQVYLEKDHPTFARSVAVLAESGR
jgi:hypothetical protein